MSLTDAEVKLENEKLKLEERRVKILESEHAASTKKSTIWNTTIIVALISISVPLTSLIVEVSQTQRVAEIARNQRIVENGKNALEIYMSNLDAFSCVASAEDDLPNRSVIHLQMVSAVAGNAELQNVIKSLGDKCVETTRSNDSATPLAMDFVTISTIEQLEAAGGYTVYIQYPIGDECKNLAGSLQSKLKTLGFRAPGIHGVENSPTNDEVRFYSAPQRDQWEEVIEGVTLPENANLSLVSKTLDAALPEDIFEVWIGSENSCATQQE